MFSMAPKRKKPTSNGGATKRRKAITMETKYYIIKRSEKGETNTEIGRALGLNRTTVQSIVKDKERILQHMECGASMKAVTTQGATTRIGKQHNPNLVAMEKLLLVWLEDQIQRHVPVGIALIQEKARELYEVVVEKQGEGSATESFAASRGWFNRFKVRANLHNLKLQGEVASADEEAAERFPGCLAEIIREGGYTADQVFSVEETGLFWKRMPSRTYISKEEKTAPGHKVSKERLTLLLGSNASGDFKLKPLLVYLAENPRALNGIFKPQLPVIWKANKKAWVTDGIFEEWFNDHFVPSAKKHLEEKGQEFKVLLVLNTGPGYPINLGEVYPEVEVVYLPPNTTSLLQPMGQGVIGSFKAYYTRRTFRHVLSVTENSGGKLDVRQVWKTYSILDAIKNIAAAWNEVKKSNLNGAWKKLCPNFVMNFTEFEKGESLDAVRRNIVQYSERLNLGVEAEDVNELLESHGEELSAEDLIELEKQMIREEEEEAPAPKPPRALNAKILLQGLALIEEGLFMIGEQDPNVERFTKYEREIQDAITFYKETVKKKQMRESMQAQLENFDFKSKSPAPPAILNPEEMSYPDSTTPEIVVLSPPTSPGVMYLKTKDMAH
ncbi:tigger transposable element-derived protein 1-like isoform X2 [Macrobrachium nipponense]|uniref:tigger transposable element-derived protein 1-like isoform X2 n=1 Tax=Macrobrachium nipponense TaxID=159736 RepID=UPI0030C88C84